MRRFKNFLLLFILLLCGCMATTKIASVRDPSFADITFNQILIDAPFYDLLLQQTAESAFSQHLQAKGITVFTRSQLFPPTRSYSDEEILKRLEENKIDGILVVGLTDYWESSYYIPETYETDGYVNGYISDYSYGLNFHKTIEKSGGYYISSPNINFDIRLLIPSGKIIWRAITNTAGNIYADFNDLMNSLASTTVKKLKNDGIIKGAVK